MTFQYRGDINIKGFCCPIDRKGKLDDHEWERLNDGVMCFDCAKQLDQDFRFQLFESDVEDFGDAICLNCRSQIY